MRIRILVQSGAPGSEYSNVFSTKLHVLVTAKDSLRVMDGQMRDAKREGGKFLSHCCFLSIWVLSRCVCATHRE